MFKPGLYQFIPPLEKRHLPFAIVWIAIVVIAGSIGQSNARAAADRSFTSPVLVSPLQSPLPTPTPLPPVESVAPMPGAHDVPRNAPVQITFRIGLDRSAIERGLAIEPPITGTLKWQGPMLIFTPDRGWQAGQTYRVLLKYQGEVLQPSWTFTVKPIIISAVPSATNSAGWSDPIEIEFNQPMDRASVEAAFSIKPDMRGAFEWRSNTLIFTPGGEWREGAHYDVMLTPAIKTAQGEQPLRDPYRFYFTTVTERGEVSFGYGPKFQVVDPAGRRAVQFLAWGDLIRPATVRLYAISIEQFLNRYTSGFRGVGPVEDKAIEVDDLKLLRTWRVPVKPAELFLPSDLQPGLYVLTLEHPASKRDELIVLYTHHTLVLKQADGHIAVWASRIGGGPLDHMRIRVFDRAATLLVEGQSDARGLFVTQVPIDPQPLIVIGERDGEITASGLSNEWEQRGWEWWWQPQPKAQLTRAYIYTDRPIYRPGQTVHVKGVTRYDNDAVYSRIPLEWDVIVRLRDARDNVVATKKLHANEYGTLDTSFDLAEGCTLGVYHIEMQIKDDVHRQTFKVEAYRKPEYEVVLYTDRSNIVNGESISLTVEARTYFGAPLSGATIELAQFTRNYDWWYGEGDSGTWRTLGQSTVAGHSDGQGRWSEQVNLNLEKYLFNEYYMARHTVPIMLDVTVKDDSGQAVSVQARVVVHDAALDVTGSLERYMYKPGETITIGATARDIDSKPLAGENITARILKWSGHAYDQLVGQTSGTTDRIGKVTLNLNAPQPGWYRVEIGGRDMANRTVTSADWLWVYDPQHESAWYYENSAALQINADRDRYMSGDTAQLLIRTPVNGPALLTVERGRTRRAQVIQLTMPTTSVPLTIQDDDAPNIYVSVNAYKPNQAMRQDWYTSIPEANLLVASTNLSVSADQRRLSIQVTPDRSTYGPRDEAAFTLQVRGADGQPAQAELSLALVDEAIYALSQELAQDPFEAFYGERDNLVRTFDSLRPIRYIGDGMGGGGGDGGLLGNPRFNFPDTAHWNPRIVTDANGHAVVKVTLPDSLTRWRAVVRAVTPDEFPRVGEAIAKITTTQPIVIRPELPRSLVSGDQVLISAIVHNNTDRDREAVVWAELNGAQTNADDASLITRTVVISGNGSTIVGWPVMVNTFGSLTVTLRVKSGQALDAVRMSVPIVPLAVPDVQAIIGDFTSSVEHTVELPAHTIKEASTLQIDLSPSIAASVIDGLAYLTGYPFGCVEQTMSKALPNAVVGRAFNVLGVDNPGLRADLPRKVNAGLQRLYGYQHNDGGWGWWFDDSTDDYQTAYVLFGLAMTRQAGYEVEQRVIDRGVEYLAQQVPNIDDSRTRAYALFALALAGKGDLAQTRQVTDTIRLDAFSQAGIAIALHELGDEVRAQQMLEALIKKAVVSGGEAYWDTGAEDGHYHQKAMSSSTRSTALALDAIVRIRPDDPIVTKVVRWLMARRAPTGWGTTQETAYAIVALTDYLQATRELNAGSMYRMYINDKMVQQGKLSAGQIQQRVRVPLAQLQDGANRVRIERDGSGGRIYYKITQNALIAGTTDRTAGPIAVTRAYLDPGSEKPITVTKPGAIVKVELKVTLPDEGWYVAIEDPLPGGLEGVNERLNTTSFTARQNDYEQPDEFFYEDFGYSNKEVHDDRVVFFVTHLECGAHTFTYLARATRAGAFNALPARVYLMYAPEQWGRSASSVLGIE